MSQYITIRLVFSSARKVQVNWPPSGGWVFVTESGCYSQIRWMVDNKMLVTFTRVVTHLYWLKPAWLKYPNDLLKRHYWWLRCLETFLWLGTMERLVRCMWLSLRNYPGYERRRQGRDASTSSNISSHDQSVSQWVLSPLARCSNYKVNWTIPGSLREQ